MLQPVAVPDHADRVIPPQPHAAQHDILAAVGVDDVVHREQGLGAGRAHIDEDQPAIFQGRIGRLPDIHALAELLAFARHIDALPAGVVEPAVVAAAQPCLFYLPPFQGGAAMRAMRIERADPALLVAEDDDLLA